MQSRAFGVVAFRQQCTGTSVITCVVGLLDNTKGICLVVVQFHETTGRKVYQSKLENQFACICE
jgi:hypothetical protein